MKLLWRTYPYIITRRSPLNACVATMSCGSVPQTLDVCIVNSADKSASLLCGFSGGFNGFGGRKLCARMHGLASASCMITGPLHACVLKVCASGTHARLKNTMPVQETMNTHLK